MITRIVIYSVLGLVLSTLGHEWDSPGFWCIVGLFWAVEHLARMDTINDIEQEVERLKEQRNKEKN